MHAVDTICHDERRKRSMVSGCGFTKLAHFAEYRDLAPGPLPVSEQRERRGHRTGVGIITFVNEHDVAIAKSQDRALAPPGDRSKPGERRHRWREIGRASCRERVCQYV